VNRGLRKLIILFLLILWCSRAYAFKVFTSSTGAEVKWITNEVTYYINPSGGPTGSISAISTAMQTWTDVATSSFTFINNGTIGSTAHCDYPPDGYNIVTFGPMGPNGTLAENYFWYYTTGEMIDSDIQFNTSYLWKTDSSPDAYDVQNVGTHELGHSLSLDDLYEELWFIARSTSGSTDILFPLT
jgi:hypothetical protein